MATLWTNNSLSTGFYDESSQPDAPLSTDSFVPSLPPCMANSAPQSSSTVSVPVAVSVPDPAFLVLVVNTVKAFLVGEKDPGPTSNNGCVLRLVIQLAWRHRQLLGAFPINRPVCSSKRRRSYLLGTFFRNNSRCLRLQRLKVDLILRCPPLLPYSQPRTRWF